MDIHKKKEEEFLQSYEYDNRTTPDRAREVREENRIHKENNDGRTRLDIALESVIDAFISGKYDKRNRRFKKDWYKNNER